MTGESTRPVSPVIIGGVRIALGLFQTLYSLARLIPASDRIVFLSRQSDTATPDIVAVRDRLTADNPKRRVTVLARKLKSDTDVFYGLHLLRQVWHLAHSRHIVLDSYSFLTSNLTLAAGTSVTQMWHAIGSFKKFGWDDIPSDNARRRQLATVLRMHAGNTRVVASSDKAADNFASAFNVDRDRVVVSPLPRVDAIVDAQRNDETRRRVREAQLPDLSARALLIAPTLHSELEDRTNGIVDGIRATADKAGWTVWESYHPVTDPTPRRWTTADLLAGADAFVTASSTETLGLVALEAMASGVPVLTSNATSLPEVVGDAGLMVDPDDVGGMCDSLALLLEDEATSQRMAELGVARAQTFSWDRCAQETLGVYQHVARQRGLV